MHCIECNAIQCIYCIEYDGLNAMWWMQKMNAKWWMQSDNVCDEFKVLNAIWRMQCDECNVIIDEYNLLMQCNECNAM